MKPALLSLQTHPGVYRRKPRGSWPGTEGCRQSHSLRTPAPQLSFTICLKRPQLRSCERASQEARSAATAQAGVALLPGRLKSLPLEAAQLSTSSLSSQHSVQQRQAQPRSSRPELQELVIRTSTIGCLPLCWGEGGRGTEEAEQRGDSGGKTGSHLHPTREARLARGGYSPEQRC